MHPDVHCSSIHSGQDMNTTTKVSFDIRFNKKDMKHIYDKGKGSQMHGDEREFDLGWWNTMQYTDGVSWNCTLETYILLINLIFFKKIND